MDKLDEIFKKLEQEGRNNVDNLVKIMKDSKVIETTKEAEEKARAMLSDVKENHHVTLKTFQDAMGRIAEEQHRNIQEVSETVVRESETLYDAVSAGIQAFKDTWLKRK